LAGGLSLSYFGITPYDVVLQHRKMSLLRFASQRELAKPVLCVPALISRSYVLDLSANASLIGTLCEAGYDVYLVDWGLPGEEDASLSLDTIVTDYIERAVERVKALSDSKHFTMLGYCMGGTLCVLWSGLNKLGKRDNLITLAAPYDFAEGGVLAHWCKDQYLEVDRITEVFGNVPAHLVETVFTMLRPTAKTRAALAFSRQYENMAASESFRAMDRWASDWTAFPGQAAREWIKWFYQENSLMSREIKIGGRKIDARDIKAAALVVAAPGDAIVPAASSRALQYALGSKDITYKDVGGGHIGMVAGKPAKAQLFPLLLDWLGPRSI
ncbi:MAG: alpha/beta fold hydrolase, partial [Candidatus Eremiobacteraeota bacterium]|nr:alpha/beta fold hydrolase [Candidatus Eremiobacteraeota bacterium]